MLKKPNRHLSVWMVLILLLNTVFTPSLQAEEGTEDEVVKETVEPSIEEPEGEGTAEEKSSEEGREEPPDIEEETIEEASEESTNEKEESLEDTEEQTVADEEEVIVEEMEEELDNSALVAKSTLITQSGVSNIGLLTNTQFTAGYRNEQGKQKIVLEYSGGSALSLDLALHMRIILELPPEIAQVVKPSEVVARYDVPRVSIIGLPLLGRDKGDFDTVYKQDNFLYMDYSKPFSLGLLSSKDFKFSIEIPIDKLPPTTNGFYAFHSQTADQEVSLINLDIMNFPNSDTVELEAPIRPEPLVFNRPIYTSHDRITGEAPANTQVVITINGEEISVEVGVDGTFEIPISHQESGTIITGTVITFFNDGEYESVESSVTVMEAPDTESPETPVVEPVYSNHSEVVGTGEPNADVTVTIGSQQYPGTVDEGGNFSVDIPEQEAGTVISVTLTDDAGNVSEATETTVRAAILALRSVPDVLNFGTVAISSEKVKLSSQHEASITIEDTRGEGSSWELLAKAAPLRTSNGSHQLENALVYDDGQKEHLLKNDYVKIYSGQTGEEPLTEITWSANQGPLIIVDPSEARAEKYSTTITWNLVNAP